MTRILFFSLLFTISSCATIIKGSRQDIAVSSYPPKADVYVDNEIKGQTPLIIKMKRNNSHSIKIKLDKYQPQEVMLKRKFGGWIFGNLIFGGGLGIIIDLATGSSFHLNPKTVNAQLESEVIINKNDPDNIQALVNENFIFNIKDLDSIPRFIGDKSKLLDVFQKAQSDSFMLAFFIREDGSMDPGSLYSDDKYIPISNIAKIGEALKFSPGLIKIGSTLVPVKTRIKLLFVQKGSKKIPESGASFVVEKKNQSTSVLGYPQEYPASIVNSIIDINHLLKGRTDGTFIFGLSKYKTTAVISYYQSGKTDNNFFVQNCTIIKYKFSRQSMP